MTMIPIQIPDNAFAMVPAMYLSGLQRKEMDFDQLKGINQTLEQQINTLTNQNTVTQQQLMESNERIQALMEEIQDLKDNLPGTLPDDDDDEPLTFNPSFSKDGFKNVIAVSIVKDDTPSEKQNQLTRDAIVKFQQMGGNVWTGLLSESEVNAHLKLAFNDSKNNLIKFGLTLDVEFLADSCDRIYEVIWNESDEPEAVKKLRTKTYAVGLWKLGARAHLFNDMNGEKEVTQDGKKVKVPRFTRDEAVIMLQRWREAIKDECPDIPLVASLTSAADTKVWEEVGFDIVEAQTFGKDSELDGQLAKKEFGIFVLDSRSSKITTDRIKTQRPVILKHRRNVRLYAGYDRSGNDFRTMSQAQFNEWKITLAGLRTAMMSQPQTP